jgi:hypothetical protein
MVNRSDRCCICLKDISNEIPNDWDENLCFRCAQKEHFENRSGKALDNKQRLLFDKYKH